MRAWIILFRGQRFQAGCLRCWAFFTWRGPRIGVNICAKKDRRGLLIQIIHVDWWNSSAEEEVRSNGSPFGRLDDPEAFQTMAGHEFGPTASRACPKSGAYQVPAGI